MPLYNTKCTWNPSLTKITCPLTPFWKAFRLDAPSKVTIAGHIGLKHRGNYGNYYGDSAGPQHDAGWGLLLAIRGPTATQEELWAIPVSPGVGLPPSWVSATSGNLSAADHYAAPGITGYAEIAPQGNLTWFRFEVWANCHGASNGPLLGNTDSIVEVNAEGAAAVPPYCLNNINIRVEPG